MKNLATKNSHDFAISPNGDAFISQRKVAELCGVALSTIQHFFRSNNIQTKQGLSDKTLSFSVNHYARKGRPEAIQTLSLFARAGAKAYIYHAAGYVVEAKKSPVIQTRLELAQEQVLLIMELDETKEQLAKKTEELAEEKAWYPVSYVAQRNGTTNTAYKWELLKSVGLAMGKPCKKPFGAKIKSLRVNSYHKDVWLACYPNIKL